MPVYEESSKSVWAEHHADDLLSLDVPLDQLAACPNVPHPYLPILTCRSDQIAFRAEGRSIKFVSFVRNVLNILPLAEFPNANGFIFTGRKGQRNAKPLFHP